MSITISKSLKTELYRKAIHLSSLWMPMVMLLCNKNFCIALFLGLLLINLLIEHAAYCKYPIIGSLFRRMFIKTLRHKEVVRDKFVPSGSVYILAAAFMVSVCYTQQAAAAAMSVVLISDSFAAVCGKLYGTVKFCNGKSLEGTLAFVVTAVGVVWFFFPALSWLTILFVALVAAFVEFFEKTLEIDDNFSIPAMVGFFLNLVAI